MNEQYRKQVALLVETLPLIARESMFALKGGTAINLFYRDMPRLSVDIDLTYLGFENRAIAIKNIDAGLEAIGTHCIKAGLSVTTQGQSGAAKLIVSNQSASIKIEPNYTVRGYVQAPSLMSVQASVEESFSWAEMLVGSPADVWGGKVCAALDRQHPRDLFDCEFLVASGRIDLNIVPGIVVMLLSHNKPFHELINPLIKDQRMVFQKEFAGMASPTYTYEDHQRIMDSLITRVQEAILPWKELIIDFFDLKFEPENPLFPNILRFPAIKWKVKNLEIVKEQDHAKYKRQCIQLEEALTAITPPEKNQ